MMCLECVSGNMRGQENQEIPGKRKGRFTATFSVRFGRLLPNHFTADFFAVFIFVNLNMLCFMAAGHVAEDPAHYQAENKGQ